MQAKAYISKIIRKLENKSIFNVNLVHILYYNLIFIRIKSPINKFDKINNKKYQRDSGDNSENYRRNPALITPE